VPAFTITSTVNNLLRRGAHLIIVDSDLETWSMNVSLLEGQHVQNVSGAILTHIFGLSGNIARLIDIFDDSVSIIEDAAESLGAKFNADYCGTLGKAGIFSFYANKVITSGEGGAVVTNSQDFSERLKYYRNLCFGPERFVHQDLGWNYRMSTIQAALLIPQLERIPSIIDYKTQIAMCYRQGLSNIAGIEYMPERTLESENTYWVFPILVNHKCKMDRKTLQSRLAQMGVETRRLFCPIHLQPYLQRYPYQLVGDMAVSEMFWEQGLYLPSGPGITMEEVNYVIDCLQIILN